MFDSLDLFSFFALEDVIEVTEAAIRLFILDAFNVFFGFAECDRYLIIDPFG